MNVVEITGTIVAVHPLEFSNIQGTLHQKIILNNVQGTSANIDFPDRILVTVRYVNENDVINFRVGDPITVKGDFVLAKPGNLSYMKNTHVPFGFIRYNDKIFA